MLNRHDDLNPRLSEKATGRIRWTRAAAAPETACNAPPSVPRADPGPPGPGPARSKARQNNPSPAQRVKSGKGRKTRKGKGRKTVVCELPPMAGAARPRKRHFGLLLSFLLFVALPSAAAWFYMYHAAADQYETRVGFSVRAEESQSALDLLSGLTGFSRASSSDTDILYEFIQSQEIVQRINAQMDLRGTFTRPGSDPLFALKENASLEELAAYWPRMVRVYYDGSTGLIEVRVHAFTPEEAHRLAGLIYSEASEMINALSDVARADATRYAAEERDKAIERLIAARQAMTAFRIRTQIVDPEADIAGRMGLLNTLQAQLTESLIELDLLRQTTRSGDPRLSRIERRIAVIEDRITAERRKLGVGAAAGEGAGDTGYAGLFGEYERLQVDREFAEASYLSALSAYDAAVAEAQRTSRYLTAYLRPARAETSTAPDRLLLTGLLAGFALVLWFTGVLIYYSFRDRR